MRPSPRQRLTAKAAVSGTLLASDESFEVAWFADEVDTLPMVASIRKRLNDWRTGQLPVVR